MLNMYLIKQMVAVKKGNTTEDIGLTAVAIEGNVRISPLFL